MNILIPKFIEDSPHEGAKVLMAFLYRIIKRGEFKGIRYFLDARDARAICQRYMVDPGPTFGDYTESVRIGKCSDTHWFIEFQKDITETTIYSIEREDLKQIWCYLVARMQGDKNIIQDWNQKGFPDREPPYLKIREDQYLFSTTGRPSEHNETEMLLKRQRKEEVERKKVRRPVGRPKGAKNKNNR